MLYTANNDFNDSVKYMQKDINSCSQHWWYFNGIRANTEKNKVMMFGTKHSLDKVLPYEIKFGKVPLQPVSSYKHLGVTIDGQVNFNLHVNRIIASVSGKLKQLQRMRNFLNEWAAMLVYKSMMLPIIKYGDVLLSATTIKNRKRLQVLQNKGLRCALNKGIGQV